MSEAKFQHLQACIDRDLPIELYVHSMRSAVKENPNNAPTINTHRLPPGVIPDIVNLAGLTGKLWKPGRLLRVRFMDGDSQVHERITNVAKEWLNYANLKLEFGNDPDAEIRITFTQAGSWSYIGTDNLAIPKSQATMNYGWLTKATPLDEYHRVVLHEFGHALGAIHEHQNPAVNIPWDKEAVYDFYGAPPNNWSRDQVDVNFFTRYSADLTQFSDFDRESIMLYPVPNELTQGDYAVGWNKTLSDKDKSFMQTLYPFVEKLENELVIDAPATKESIGSFGEIDVFNFRVTNPGRYRMETTGRNDLQMSLFGPDDSARFLQQDDDSGRRLNPRIIASLGTGVYTIRVRHFSKRRTGDYTVFVRTEF
ncbi:MAG: peptidase [Chloroflexota bacterium]